MNKVLREEKKFLISVADFIQLSHKVEQVMLSDPHNGTHGYILIRRLTMIILKSKQE